MIMVATFRTGSLLVVATPQMLALEPSCMGV